MQDFSVERTIIKRLFEQNPDLYNYKIPKGVFVKYKGRYYCWTYLINNLLLLTPEMLQTFGLRSGEKLLSIRGSNIALVMGVKGPLIEHANNSDMFIQSY